MAELNKGKFALILGGIAASGALVAILAVTQPWSSAPETAPSPASRSASPEAMQPPQSSATATSPETDRRAEPAEAPAETTPATAAAPVAGTPADARTAQSEEAATPPSFDIVRVEPNGETVIAGRGAPGATIELLRDGKSHARAVADTSGLFAFVPPPLPAGSQEIALQSIAPDGTKARSKETVTVVIASGQNARPLVALAAPDKPTVVLSSPEPATAAKPTDAAAERTAEAVPASKPNGAPPAAAAPPTVAQGSVSKPEQTAENGRTVARPPVRIASVESEEGGRLFVSGHAAPGATVRLYLNDTMIAPGGSDTEGKIAFAIGKGVRPGEYRVRLDDVDPVSGDVKTRAEVKYVVPEPTASLAAPAPSVPGFAATKPDNSQQVATLDPLNGATSGSTAPGVVAAPPMPPGGGQPGSVAPAAPSGSASPSAPQSDQPATSSGSRDGSGTAGETRVAAASAREIAPSTVVVPEISTAIVSRGDNLWRISRRIYGRGIRYTVIYDANQDQIRNPGLIYPGQVFVLPSEGQSVGD